MKKDVTLQMKLLHGLNNKIRYQILCALQENEKNVSELIEVVDGSQSVVSQHLACLRDCGLIEKRVEGKYAFYRLATPKITLLIQQLEKTMEDFYWDSESDTVMCHHHME